MNVNRSFVAVAAVAIMFFCAPAHASSPDRAWASRALHVLTSRPRPWVYPDARQHFPNSVYVSVATLVDVGAHRGTRHYLRATLRQGKKHFCILIRTWGGFVYYCCEEGHSSLCVAFDPKHPTRLLASRGGAFSVKVFRRPDKMLMFRAGFAKAVATSIDVGALLPSAAKARLVRANRAAGWVEVTKPPSTPGQVFSCMLKFKTVGGQVPSQLLGVYDVWRSAHGRLHHAVGIYQIPGGIIKPGLRASVTLAELRKAGFHLGKGGGQVYTQLILGSMSGGVPPPPSPAAVAGIRKLLSVLQTGRQQHGSRPLKPATAAEAPSASALIPALREAVYSHYALATCMEHAAKDSAYKAARAATASADKALAVLLPQSFGRKGVSDLFNIGPGGALSPGWDRLRKIFRSRGVWYFSVRAGQVATRPKNVRVVSVMLGRLLSDHHVLIKSPEDTLRIRKVVVKSLAIRGFYKYDLPPAASVAVPPDTVVIDSTVARQMTKAALRHTVPVAERTDFSALQRRLELLVPNSASSAIPAPYLPGLVRALYLRGFVALGAGGVQSYYMSVSRSASEIAFWRETQLTQYVAHLALGRETVHNALQPLEALWAARSHKHPLLDFIPIFAIAGARRVNGEQMTPVARLIAQVILDNMADWLLVNAGRYPELPRIKSRGGPRATALFCGLWRLSPVQLSAIAKKVYLPSESLAELCLLQVRLGQRPRHAGSPPLHARNLVKEAISLAPDAPAVELEGGNMLLHIGDSAGATKVMAKLANNQKATGLERALGMDALGVQACKNGDYKAAIKWFRGEINAYPDRLQGDYGLAFAYATSGAMNRAVPILHRLIRELPAGSPLSKASQILLNWIKKQSVVSGK